MLYPVLDHSDQAVARLAAQYKGKAKLEGLLRAFTDQIQDLEDALWQLASETQIDTAVGSNLDVVGKVLVQSRGSLGDEMYRLALKAKVKVNRSSGSDEDLIAVFYCVEPTMTIRVTDCPPAYVTVEIGDAITSAKSDLYRSFLHQAKAAGVTAVLLWKEVADTDCLILSDAANYPQTDTRLGLADYPAVNGGHLGGAGE